MLDRCQSAMGLGIRSVLVAAAIAAVGFFGAPAAFACGQGGYTYAGVAAPVHAYGISASITPLPAFNVLAGHVAGWVGVGGPGQGPNGTDEWLQVGFSGFPWADGSNLYFELKLPSSAASYHEIAVGLPVGRAERMAVLEMHGRPNWWRVWVNGSPASEPIHLPGSHGRWSPIATAESWDGGTGGSCNGFLYRFNGIDLAHALGGGWKPLNGGYAITSPTTQLARATGPSFLAAEGDAALRTLAGLNS
jgi:hypothetical protein